MVRSASLHATLLLTVQALSRSGFGEVQILDRRLPRQRSRLGGCELMCRAQLGTVPLAVAVKLVKDTVRTRMLDELAGAVDRTGADLGLLVSTEDLPARASKRPGALPAVPRAGARPRRPVRHAAPPRDRRAPRAASRTTPSSRSWRASSGASASSSPMSADAERPGETPGERSVRLAARMLRLGLSHEAVVETLRHDHEAVERQLDWLPYRKAKRPGAFLIEAVRKNYSPPKEAYHAQAQTRRRPRTDPLDPDAERRDRPADADAS